MIEQLQSRELYHEGDERLVEHCSQRLGYSHHIVIGVREPVHSCRLPPRSEEMERVTLRVEKPPQPEILQHFVERHPVVRRTRRLASQSMEIIEVERGDQRMRRALVIGEGSFCDGKTARFEFADERLVIEAVDVLELIAPRIAVEDQIIDI